MKKLLVLVFIASAAMACSKNKPAATTPPPAGDAKMEGETKPADGEMKPEEKTEGTPDAADPCAPPK